MTSLVRFLILSYTYGLNLTLIERAVPELQLAKVLIAWVCQRVLSLFLRPQPPLRLIRSKEQDYCIKQHEIHYRTMD